MSKAVLISIRPKWCELILSGKKTIEIRKTRPKLDTPFKCYIYCTKEHGNNGESTRFYEDLDGPFSSAGKNYSAFLTGTVIGEFICDGIAEIKYELYDAVDDAPVDGFYQWWDAPGDWPMQINSGACLTHDEWQNYLGTQGGFAWHISDLVIYDEQKKLSEFMKKPCDFAASCGACGHAKWLSGHRFDGCELTVARPPQSWCYVETLENEKGE